MKIKRIVAMLLAILTVVSLFGCAKAEDDGKDKEIVASTPAVWSDTTVITEVMFAYYYNGYYRYFLESNSDGLESMGLDPAKSLSSQMQSEEYTWQQYITVQVYRQLREMIALADCAKAEKIELNDEDKEKIEAQINEYDTLAKNANMSVEEYIVRVYGAGVTKDVMRDCIEIRFLANKYYEKLWSSYEFTEEECLEYFEKNRNSFVHFDYMKLTVPPEDVETLTAATDAESFMEAMRTVVTKNNFVGDYDRFADSIEALLLKKVYKRANYDPYTAFSKWVVEEDRKPYDIHTKKETSGNVTVSMILPTNDPGAVSDVLYRDDVPIKNVKYMVFEDGEGYKGKVKADTIYKNWQEKATEERFDKLIEEYDGGTAEGVTRGLFNDNVNDWIFDTQRKSGDCAVIEVDGGAYIVYMLEDGDPSWLTDVRNTLKQEKYAEDVNKAIDKHPTEYNEDVVYNMVEVTVIEPEATTTTQAE